MLRHLTERLPIMVTPKWLKNRIQPIAIRDVLRYLVGSATIDSSINRDFDIGGPEVFTYMEMMQIYAEVAGLRRRIIIPLPVLTPKLASGWIGLVTPVPVTLAKRLVASLKHEVVARNDEIRKYVPDHPDGMTDFRKAVSLALTRIKNLEVETRWSSARHQARTRNRFQLILIGLVAHSTSTSGSISQWMMCRQFGKEWKLLAVTMATPPQRGLGNSED